MCMYIMSVYVCFVYVRMYIYACICRVYACVRARAIVHYVYTFFCKLLLFLARLYTVHLSRKTIHGRQSSRPKCRISPNSSSTHSTHANTLSFLSYSLFLASCFSSFVFTLANMLDLHKRERIHFHASHGHRLPDSHSLTNQSIVDRFHDSKRNKEHIYLSRGSHAVTSNDAQSRDTFRENTNSGIFVLFNDEVFAQGRTKVTFGARTRGTYPWMGPFTSPIGTSRCQRFFWWLFWKFMDDVTRQASSHVRVKWILYNTLKKLLLSWQRVVHLVLTKRYAWGRSFWYNSQPRSRI